jgi:hypothetical protein
VKIAKHNIQRTLTQFLNPARTIFASHSTALQERTIQREKRFVKTKILCGLAVTAALALLGAGEASAQVKLIAKGTLTESSAGLFADLSGLDTTWKTEHRQICWAAWVQELTGALVIRFSPCPLAGPTL